MANLNIVRDVIQSGELSMKVCELQYAATRVQHALNRVAADVVYDLRNEAYYDARIFDKTIRELEALVEEAQNVLTSVKSYKEKV